MNIFAVMGNKITPCEYYRVMQPLEALRLRGHHTAYMTAESLVKEAYKNHSAPWTGADIILMNRLVIKKKDHAVVSGLIDMFRGVSKDVRLVYDSDDDLTGKYRRIYDDESEFPELILFDRLTVTTSLLAKTMRPYHPYITIVPNYIAVSKFAHATRLSTGFTVGLTGNITHVKDWEAVIEPLNAFTDRYGAKVFVTGTVPEGIHNILTLHDFGLAPAGVDLLPFELYPLIPAQCDVVLAPLDPSDHFNFSKSPIKSLEAAASARNLADGTVGGAASIVVSNPPIYTGVVTHRKTGLLVQQNSKEQWYKALELLFLNHQLRMEIQRNALKQVVERWDIVRTGAEVYERTFQNILKTPRLSLSPSLLSRYGSPHPTTAASR